MSKKSRSNAVSNLALNEEALARGTSRITLDAGEDSAQSVVSHFLRAYRGRLDLVRLVPSSKDFAATIEKLRTHLFAGELDSAEALLATIEAGNDFEQGELSIETLRLKRFRGKLDEALSVSDTALRNPTLSELSRMTCHQLRGSIYLEKKEHENALRELDLAIALAETYSLAGSAFSARAFRVQALAELGRREDSGMALGSLKSHLETIDQEELWLDRLLTVIRAEVHFHRVFSDAPNWKRAALEALEIATWLGDSRTAEKCARDLEANPVELAAAPIRRYSGWTFLPSLNLVLSHFPRKVSRLENSPVALKFLAILGTEKLPLDQLFEKVYGLRFVPDRHTSHMRKTISKLRTLLPSGALSVKDGIVSLV